MSAVFVPVIRSTVIIEGEEYRHLTRSLRVRTGEMVWLTDGKGTLARGSVRHITRSQAEITVLERLHQPGEPPVPISILAAPLRQPERSDWLVEKAVELGATALYFLPMARAVRKTVDISRLERVARAALKQNLRSVLPEIRYMESWEAIPWDAFSVRLMGEIGAPAPLREKLPPVPRPILWIIGPEGDFTPEEIHRLKEYGAIGVSLGRLRLRAETAGVLFLSALKALWGY